MPFADGHDGENIEQPFFFDAFMEQIAVGRDENPPRSFPRDRLEQPFAIVPDGTIPDWAGLGLIGQADPGWKVAQTTARKTHGIAVRASRTDHGAASDDLPCSVGPGDQ